ncbi:hypothetical protein U2071_15765, partial [Listeria monocytogenes]|uniref:hypothetical protein n=1 Tax=Listeria monocytogenes TaxID=1639 RepID=UPI002FDBC3B7
MNHDDAIRRELARALAPDLRVVVPTTARKVVVFISYAWTPTAGAARAAGVTLTAADYALQTW